MKIKTV